MILIAVTTLIGLTTTKSHNNDNRLQVQTDTWRPMVVSHGAASQLEVINARDLYSGQNIPPRPEFLALQRAQTELYAAMQSGDKVQVRSKMLAYEAIASSRVSSVHGVDCDLMQASIYLNDDRYARLIRNNHQVLMRDELAFKAKVWFFGATPDEKVRLLSLARQGEGQQWFDLRDPLTDREARELALHTNLGGYCAPTIESPCRKISLRQDFET